MGRGGRLWSVRGGRLGGAAGFGLELAALEVLSQRRRQPPLLPGLLGGLLLSPILLLSLMKRDYGAGGRKPSRATGALAPVSALWQ